VNYPFLTRKERDNETGLDYFNARYYSSVQGRFTSADPIFISDWQVANPQLWNLYNYVGNNPLNATDPTGMEIVQLGQHTDAEIEARRKAIDAEKKAIRKDSSLTKAQQDERRGKLEAEKQTLGLEQQGNKVVSQYLAKLDSIGERNGLQLSDFSLTTEPVKDFGSDPSFVKAFGGDPKKAEAAAKGNAGTGMFVWLGFSTQIFVNATSNDYKGSRGGIAGTDASDYITYGGTAARHEQTHFGPDNSEHTAYTVQLRILQKFGPAAFKSKGFYDNAAQFVTAGSQRKD
jgi:RHS repeat-associated protein